MKNEIKEYKELILQQAKDPETDKKELAEKLLVRIGFYQHERLVHLLVMLFFAVFFLISLALMLTVGGWGPIALTILFLGLLVPYIKHYYFLENSVQKMYTYYYKIEKI